MELKENIKKGVEELFKRYGIKSITMDDIARHLSISKKTLYQFYKDKDAVVLSFTQSLLDEYFAEMTRISEEAENVIKESFMISDFLKNNVCNVNPSILYDLKKYHIEAWNLFTNFKKNFMVTHLSASLNRGKREGYFRKDIDVEINSILRIEMAVMPFNPDVFPVDKFDNVKVHYQVFQLFIHGIMTLKGHALYNSYLQLAADDE